jgi:hypothetical protein
MPDPNELNLVGNKLGPKLLPITLRPNAVVSGLAQIRGLHQNDFIMAARTDQLGP